METLEDTRRRLVTVRDLHGLVRTVKVLSAVAMRQYQKAARVQEDYRQILMQAYQALYHLGKVDPWSAKERAPARPLPSVSGAECLIVLGTDQGLCGPFNEAVLSLVVATGVPEHLLLAGARLEAPLREAGHPPETLLSIPSSLAGVTFLVREMLLHVESWSSQLEELTVEVVHQCLGDGPGHQPVRTRLLPPDPAWLAEVARAPWESRGLPMTHLAPPRLLSQLVRQWLFSELYRVVVQSMAAENQARLLSMQAAEKTLADRAGQLELESQQLHQELVTDELLDLLAGYEAVSPPER